MFHHTIAQNCDRFLCFVSLLFLTTCLFHDFGFILSVLFDRSFTISLDVPTVKSTFGVFITDVFKSVLFVVSVLWRSFCLTGVAFFSVIFFLSSRLITAVSITSLFSHSWIINDLVFVSKLFPYKWYLLFYLLYKPLRYFIRRIDVYLFTRTMFNTWL